MMRATKAVCLAISVTVLMLFASYAYGMPVTQEMAQQVAKAFLQKEQTTPPQIRIGAKKVLAVEKTAQGFAIGNIRQITDEDGNILAYVQELEPQGFIITSGDDSIRPVIGFSLSGKFPPNIRKGDPLLDLLRADIQARQKAALTGDEKLKELAAENNEKWDSVFKESGKVPLSIREAASTQWGPYIQTTWSQGGIYRSKCPYKDPGSAGARRPTGCTAISMAQIMYMHKYPKSISFSDGDHYTSKAAIKNAQNEIIGYDLIDLDGDSSSYGFPTFAQLSSSLSQIAYGGSEEEIANLCFATGIKLRMTYGRSGSGAWRPTAYVDEFDYGSAIHSRNWSSVNDYVVQNMKDGLPAQIAIYNSDPSITGGHSIIIDGYRDDGFFHLNYGWGASSPDSITETWYNIPDMPYYDVVSNVIYDISVYQGWNQYGANQQNTFGTVYAAPRENEILQKWRVTCPSEFSFSNILIGTSNYIYAAASTNASSGNPFVYVIDQFGTTLRQIEINRDGNIEFMCQSEDGELFAAMEGGYIYRIDPKKGSVSHIFTEPYGDDIYSLKIDEQGYLIATTFYHVYALTRTGNYRWTAPFVAPSGTMFLGDGYIPAIDVSRQRIYIIYYNTSTKHAYLAAINRSNGQVVQTRDFGAITIPSFRAISLGNDGTVYVRMPGILYALNPDNLLGTPRWSKSLLITHTPAVGRDGTLYFPYWVQNGSTWYNRLGAFNPSNGAEKWNITFQLDPSEEDIFQPYIAGNGIVLFTIEHDGSPKTYTLHAYKDNVSSAEEMWHYNAGTSGGNYAFGPGRTVYAWGKTGLAQTIYALSDGDVGDPYGAGMDFENNSMPNMPASPNPSDGAQGQGTENVQLSWTCSDPNDHALKYDIYACALVEGEEAAFVPVATQIDANTFTLSGLKEGTQYLWTVVATDGQAISQGPVWTFSTIGGEPPLLGDINGDGVLDLADVVCGLKIISGLECTEAYSGADVNADGKLGVHEILYVLQKVSGLR